MTLLALANDQNERTHDVSIIGVATNGWRPLTQAKFTIRGEVPAKICEDGRVLEAQWLNTQKTRSLVQLIVDPPYEPLLLAISDVVACCF